MQRGSSTILRISPASAARVNTATRKQRPVERIQVDEKQGKRFEKTSKGIERWKDRDRRAGGIEERKETGEWGLEGCAPRRFHDQESRASRRSVGSWPNALSVLSEPPRSPPYITGVSGSQTFFFLYFRSFRRPCTPGADSDESTFTFLIEFHWKPSTEGIDYPIRVTNGHKQNTQQSPSGERKQINRSSLAQFASNSSAVGRIRSNKDNVEIVSCFARRKGVVRR